MSYRQDDFVIEGAEDGPALVCQVCDWWVHIEDLSLTDLIEAAQEHCCPGGSKTRS